MKIIDSHQHLWDVSRFDYAISASSPVLNRSFSCTDYRAAAAEILNGIEIDAAVLIEAGVERSAMRRQTHWALGLADDPRCLTTVVVAACAIEDVDFPSWLDEFATHPRLCGVRRTLHNQDDGLSRSPTFLRNVRSLADASLPFDLCVNARQLPIACELVRQCPNVQFVLDHCASPDICKGSLDPWRADMKEIASFENVVCKISGLITCADHTNWKSDDLRPFVEHAIDCFGPDRVMFGSDWPVCTQAGSLRGWVDTLQQLTASFSATERASIFRENAIRTYRLKL